MRQASDPVVIRVDSPSLSKSQTSRGASERSPSLMCQDATTLSIVRPTSRVGSVPAPCRGQSMGGPGLLRC